VRNVIAEHAVDHVADGVGESGDFASASLWAGGARRRWIVGYRIRDAKGRVLDIRFWSLDSG
jgi:hypothetical protein